MITKMRRGSKSPLFLGLLGLIAVAFVVTGVNAPGTSSLGGLGAASLASVDGVDVTVAEVTDQAQRRLQAAQQQQPDLTIGQLVASGGVEEIVTGLISQKALRAFAQDAGMRVSKAVVDGQIASLPAFFGLTGKFSEETYRSKLAQQRVTEAELRDDLTSSSIQRQLLIPVGASARVPVGVASPYATMLLEARSGQVGVVPADPDAGAAPSEAELAKFYADNRAKYVIPERRVLRYALLGPQQAGVQPPSDAEIAAYYKANAKTYAGAETRVLSQVVLPDQAAAAALAAKVAGGQTFAQAAAAAGFSAGDISIGPQDRDGFVRLSAANVADQAFGLREGAIGAPIQSPLGWHVVKVDEIRQAASRTLASARAEIQDQLSRTKTEEGVARLVEQIEDQVGDGASFADVAAARKLAVVTTPPITSGGIAPGVPQFQAAPELRPLLAAAFATEAGEDPTVEAIPGAPGTPTSGYALVAVDRIVPAAPPPLAAVRSDVLADFRGKRAFDRARAVAAGIVARVNAGTPMAAAFTQAGVRLPPRAITAKRLDVARTNQQIPPPLQMLFSLPKGRARLLQAPQNAGFYVVYLAGIVPGDAGGSPGLIEATRTQFSQVAGQEYVEQFVRAVEGSKKVVRDAAALRTLKAQLDGTAARKQ